MSPFNGLLAFPTDPAMQDAVKIGVLMGSILSAVAGAFVLRLAPTAASLPQATAARPAA